MTWPSGRPLILMAAYVRTSTGLETMSRMPLKPLSRICGMMLPKMEMFLFTRSRRVSPGFWAAPAVTPITAASETSE